VRESFGVILIRLLGSHKLPAVPALTPDLLIAQFV
jgi:hypothetical protein